MQELGAQHQQLGSSSCQYPNPRDGSSPHHFSELCQPPGHLLRAAAFGALLQPQPGQKGWGNASRLCPAPGRMLSRAKAFKALQPQQRAPGMSWISSLQPHVRSSFPGSRTGR